MADNTSGTHWPGANERLVVEEMIGDKRSKHWDACNRFVMRLVYAKARGTLEGLREEIAQDVMYKIAKNLSGFEFQCGLRTWISLLTDRYIIDMYRKQLNQIYVVSLNDSSDESDSEGEIFAASATRSRSAESLAVMEEELRTAVAWLREYTHAHSHPVRDQLILRRVFFENRSYIEVAQEVGCHPPVIGHVVRGAQRYVREKMGRLR